MYPLAAALLSAALSPAADPAEPVKLRTVEFKDVSMGGVVAYTMLVPEGWKAEGEIRWQGTPTPMPERIIQASGDDGCQVTFEPMLHFNYTEAEGIGGQGVPAPANLGEWLVEMLGKAAEGKKLKLVEDAHDKEAEKQFANSSALAAELGAKYEVRKVTYTYEKGGTAFTAELQLLYVRLPVARGGGLATQNWSLGVLLNVRGPSATFEKQKPLLYAVAQSCRSVPKWHTQAMQLRTDLLRAQTEAMAATIKAAAKRYDTLSDDDLKAWKKAQAIDDAKQNDRINGIYEVNDFKDTDGLTVKLPIHYKNYFSDGKGTYLLTNREGEPRGDWTPIKPVR